MLFACHNNQIAGFLWGYLLISPKNLKPAIFLYSIDVFKNFQNRGIGTKLIQALLKIAKTKNCAEVFVFTKENNLAAKNLYKKTGGVREFKDVMFGFKVE